jgi:hypothetical protein
MTDPTESIRRDRQAVLNSTAKASIDQMAEELRPIADQLAAEKARLKAETGGEVYDTEELRDLFEVKGFAAPLVVVRRKSDGQVGSLEFQHAPRLYFNWQPDR